jgi:hypothetical protein
MTPLLVWQAIGITALALGGVLLFLLLWRRGEELREKLLTVLTEIEKWELADLARLLRAFIVRNFFGRDSVTRVVHELWDRIQAEGIIGMLRKTSWKVLENDFLATPEGIQRVEALVAAAKAKSIAMSKLAAVAAAA